MLALYKAFINLAKYLLLFFTKLYKPALKKTLESARMNNSAGFSCQVFGFCPRGQLIIVRFKLTAGRDSGSSGQHLRTSLSWLNTQRWNMFSIQLQFLSRTNKLVEELTQQPDSHHRVAFVKDIGICVRIGVAAQSTYEHCSGDTKLKCQYMHGNIVCLCCHSRCLSSVALK